MEQIIELDAADDMASIRGRMEYAAPLAVSQGQTGNKPRRRLLLVVPRQNKALQSLVNMKLLARIVKTKAIEIAVVSNQPLVRDYAKEAGIKAFSSVGSAKRFGWITPETPVVVPNKTMPPAVAPENSPGHGVKERVKPKKYKVVQGSGRIGILQQVGALLSLVVLAVAIVVSAITLLPRATVIITPVAQPVETDLVVTADPEASRVDFQSLVFPARIDQVELDVIGQIDTVETQEAPVGLATGSVTFINRTDQEQLIPFSTTVTTSAGEPIQFKTVVTAAVPPQVDAITTVPVVAVEPGPSGNVRSGQINRFENPSYGLLVRVINESDLSGGSIGLAKVVVESDKERLQAHLRQLVQQEGLVRLEAALAEQEFIPPASLQVIPLDVKYYEFSGDVSETFGGEMQAVVRGTVVGGYNANRLALAALEAQVPPGYELDIKGLQFGAGEVLNVENQVVTFRIVASGMAIPRIDANNVAEQLAWLPVGEAQALLSQQYDLATVPGVELQPDWVTDWLGRLPFIPMQIKVVINEAVTLMAEGG